MMTILQIGIEKKSVTQIYLYSVNNLDVQCCV